MGRKRPTSQGIGNTSNLHGDCPQHSRACKGAAAPVLAAPAMEPWGWSLLLSVLLSRGSAGSGEVKRPQGVRAAMPRGLHCHGHAPRARTLGLTTAKHQHPEGISEEAGHLCSIPSLAGPWPHIHRHALPEVGAVSFIPIPRTSPGEVPVGLRKTVQSSLKNQEQMILGTANTSSTQW